MDCHEEDRKRLIYWRHKWKWLPDGVPWRDMSASTKASCSIHLHRKAQYSLDNFRDLWMHYIFLPSTWNGEVPSHPYLSMTSSLLSLSKSSLVSFTWRQSLQCGKTEWFLILHSHINQKHTNQGCLPVYWVGAPHQTSLSRTVIKRTV